MDAWVLNEDSKGAVDRQLKRITVNVEKVRSALEELRQLLPDDEPLLDGAVRRWKMADVELTLEISAESGVELIGSASVALTGGIKVRFERVTD
jgi:hypothetical protein